MVNFFSCLDDTSSVPGIEEKFRPMITTSVGVFCNPFPFNTDAKFDTFTSQIRGSNRQAISVWTAGSQTTH